VRKSKPDVLVLMMIVRMMMIYMMIVRMMMIKIMMVRMVRMMMGVSDDDDGGK